jgi:hypothetical protein
MVYLLMSMVDAWFGTTVVHGWHIVLYRFWCMVDAPIVVQVVVLGIIHVYGVLHSLVHD